MPARYKEDPQLANWVIQRRREFRDDEKRNNERNTEEPGPSQRLRQERVAKLEALGFVWKLRRGPRGSTSLKVVSWNQRLEELKAFKKEHAHCLVPRRKAPYEELHAWVTTQRQGYRKYMIAKKEGKPTTGCNGMSEERLTTLNELGFCWNRRKKKAW